MLLIQIQCMVSKSGCPFYQLSPFLYTPCILSFIHQYNKGPKQDRERHNIGIEYELLLEETLKSMAIPFETEAELRIRGTAKTPDVLLSCPVGIRVRRKNVNNEETEIAKNDQQEIQLQGEENNGTTPISHLQKRGSINLLNDDDDESDEYEWKIICWIDSKVRCFKCACDQ